MRIDSHMGAGFTVWRGQRTWFWFVPAGDGGAVGAALNESEAVREARASIEAAARRRQDLAAACAQSRVRFSAALKRLSEYLPRLEAISTRGRSRRQAPLSYSTLTVPERR